LFIFLAKLAHLRTKRTALVQCDKIRLPMSVQGQNPKLPHRNSNGGFHLKERT
jgi:hypothetical protein